MALSEKKYNQLIIILSIVIPLAVALLFGVNLKRLGFNVQPLTFLPPIYAVINAITAVILLAALWAIKNKNINLHKTLMKAAIVLSVLFLLLYIAYHITSDPTTYKGNFKFVYYFILISHILLSILVIPLVLLTFAKALLTDFVAHKKFAKYAFPIWLYVAVTGVIVYVMISPYYAN